MLQRSPKQPSAVAIHEAAYRIVATELGVLLQPPPARLLNLCRYGPNRRERQNKVTPPDTKQN